MWYKPTSPEEKEKEKKSLEKKMKEKFPSFKFNLDNFDDNFDITFSKKNNIRLDDVRVLFYINKGN